MKYKLMPEEPTAEMVLTGKHTIKGADNAEFESNIARYTYQSMWQAAPDAEPCQWIYDEIDDAWDTACGNKFCFTDAGPKDNGYLFCPGCGRELKE